MAALVVLVVGLLLTGVAAQTAYRSAADAAREETVETADLVVQHLETAILPSAQVTHALASYVLGQGGALQTVPTKAFMQGLLDEAPYVKSLSLAPGNRIRYVEPLRGNEAAVDLDLAAIPEQWAPIEPLIAARTSGLLGPFTLVQGGQGLAYRQPVFLALGDYWGLASTVIDADAYLADATAIPGVSLDRLGLQSVSPDGTVSDVFWGDPTTLPTDASDALVLPVSLPGASWRLTALPAPVDATASVTIAVAGALISALLALLTLIGLGARMRRQELGHRLGRLADQAPGMLYQLQVRPDGSSRVPYASDRMVTLFGIRPEDVADDATPMWSRVEPSDIERVQGLLQQSIAEGTPWHDRIHMRAADGSVRCFRTDATPDPDASGDVVLHGYLEDVTEEVAAEEQLRISASVFASTHDGVIIMTADGLITDVNAGFTALTGYSLDEVRGRTLEVLGSGLTPQDVYDDVRSSLDRDGFWRGELINRSRDGDVAAQAVAITAVTDEADELSHFVAVISALSTLRDDLVTGLPGREVVDDRLNQAVGSARSRSRSVALVIIGLDRFRDVNDALGHRVGDLVLKEIALRLRSVVEEPQTVARLGGDEFAVILTTHANPEGVVGALSEMSAAIGEPCRLAGREVYLTASMGVAVFPDDATSAPDLLSAADQAFRAAKDAGRDRVGYFTPTMQAHAQERARLTEDLRRAVRTEQLRAVYQPIVDLQTGRATKCEALVRWEHPELGLISPARFIPLAEASGQMIAISDWVFAHALDLIPAARDIEAEFAVSVNVSPVEIGGHHEDHVERVHLMADRGIPADALVIEITEGVLVDRSAATEQNLRLYRQAGMPFAIDDFGTGYSSLSYLQSLDVDFVKIDQSFVSGLEDGNESHALVIAIIEMAHALGLRTIAEGVETEEQQHLLHAAGCDFGQGYLFSRPVPREELLAWMRERGDA